MSLEDSKTITRRHAANADEALAIEVPRLVAAFEYQRPLAPGLRLSLETVDEVVIGRGAARQWSRADRKLALTVPDAEMSRVHVRLSRHPDGWLLDDVGSKNGTLIDGIRTARTLLGDGDLIEVGRTLFVYRDHAEQRADPGDRDLAAEDGTPDAFRTLSMDLQRRLGELVRIAPTPIPVLVLGETGTGKELVAEAIHARSGRRGPFVPVNCGALPLTLLESELFGHRRGAFSGATEDRPGLARRADGGTLFLDEVAELPEGAQAALLRLLQGGEVRPVGATGTIRVDVRVVAATHQNLHARITEGRFRRDLYARLAGYEIVMPPLRDRPEDIGSIIASLLRRIGAGAGGVVFDPHAALALFAYPYPMNVRELEQALLAALALTENGEIALGQLPPAIRAHAQAARKQLRPEDAALRARLIELLRQNRGNLSATARIVGKAPVQVRRWCSRLGIDLVELRRS